jgi:hypothetical protein
VEVRSNTGYGSRQWQQQGENTQWSATSKDICFTLVDAGFVASNARSAAHLCTVMASLLPG